MYPEVSVVARTYTAPPDEHNDAVPLPEKKDGIRSMLDCAKEVSIASVSKIEIVRVLGPFFIAPLSHIEKP